MSEVAYHSDVRFLEECDPALVERNAAEFSRIRALLASAEPSVTGAATTTMWESAHRAQYDARLSDARQMVIGLADGFDRASTALMRYADAVEAARQHLENGLRCERTLDELISRVATPITHTAQLAEPMHRWEDIRVRTGFFDGLAELGMDVDSIRDEASRAYDQAYEAFGRARSIEDAARQECLAELRAADHALPDFRAVGFLDTTDLVRRIEPLVAEIRQASADPRTSLDGSRAKPLAFPDLGTTVVSPALRHIRNLLTSLPAGYSPWYQTFPGEPIRNSRNASGIDAQHAEWIARNRELIYAAAHENHLPPDLVASIAWIEVGGKAYLWDDITETARSMAESEMSPWEPEELGWRLGGDRDETSYGPMSVQIRRGAEALGYNPETLTEPQRDEVRAALKDPAQSLFIASKHLEAIRADSGFADTPADQLTDSNWRELAARYNGGPNWQGTHAQDYARDVMAHRGEAREALR